MPKFDTDSRSAVDHNIVTADSLLAQLRLIENHLDVLYRDGSLSVDRLDRDTLTEDEWDGAVAVENALQAARDSVSEAVWNLEVVTQ